MKQARKAKIISKKFIFSELPNIPPNRPMNFCPWCGNDVNKATVIIANCMELAKVKKN